MTHITSVERIGIHKGIEQSISDILEARFSAPLPTEIHDSLARVDDPEALRALLKQAVSGQSLEAFLHLANDTAASDDR